MSICYCCCRVYCALCTIMTYGPPTAVDLTARVVKTAIEKNCRQDSFERKWKFDRKKNGAKA